MAYSPRHCSARSASTACSARAARLSSFTGRRPDRTCLKGRESAMAATVGDVMTSRVIAVKRSADYKEICCVLRRYRVSACPVINDAGKVVGVVSEADLLYKVADPSPPMGLIRLRWKLGEES